MSTAANREPGKPPPLARIGRRELQAKIARGDDFVLIDTLPKQAFAKGHLPGAINIPSEDILTEAPRRLPDRHTELVVYCANGRAGARKRPRYVLSASATAACTTITMARPTG